MPDAWLISDIRTAEQELLAAHRPLMRQAASALAQAVLDRFAPDPDDAHHLEVTVLVGSGSNGGDGLHAAAMLAARGCTVNAVLCAAGVHVQGLRAAEQAGVRCVRITEPGVQSSDQVPQVWLGDAVATAFTADVLLDAITGIGAVGGLRDDARRIIELLVELTSSEGVEGPFVVAVDGPSGIGLDEATVPGPVLPADLTLTFGAAKIGLIAPPAAHLAGQVQVVDLGFEQTSNWPEPAVRQLGRAQTAAHYPQPRIHDHKYVRGVLGIDAGSKVFPGAGVLTTMAALATGVGMVRFTGEESVGQRVLDACPEAVLVPGKVHAWVIGPGTPAEGMDRSSSLEKFARTIDDAQLLKLPVVVDAGALEALPSRVVSSVVITPHAGELARLLSWRGHDVEREDIMAEPVLWAQRAHDITGATVLLKGSITVVVGAGGQTLVCGPAVPWLATAGTGDVLAGVLGAVLTGTYARTKPGAELTEVVASAVNIYQYAAASASAGGPFTVRELVHSLPTAVRELLNPEL